MSTRMIRRLGKRRLVVAGLSVGAFTAVVALLVLLPFLAKSALGAPNSGGGGCVPAPQPVCTFKGHTADASFFGSDSSDPCILTDAEVHAFQSLVRPEGTTSLTVFVFISKFNKCTGAQVESAANIDPITFLPDFTGTAHFGPQLSTGQLTGTAPMFDETSATPTLLFTTTINVSWQGLGPSTTTIDSMHVRAPGLILHMRSHGSSRGAAAAGTVTDETGTNLATSPTLAADLNDARGGTVQITKP
jgi:hypothetical protein